MNTHTIEMNNILRTILTIGLILTLATVKAEKWVGAKSSHAGSLKATTAGCSPASSFSQLEVNNVRARINTGGDMWWDLENISRYYIPKDGSATSMFSGSLWIGGLDINNQLKLAAVRYRQDGNDYWTGPLTIDGSAAVEEATCAAYDRHFFMSRAMVDEFIGNTDPETGAFLPSEDYTIPNEILEWPAHGDVELGQSFYLAPFFDANGDGEYDPLNGDYPHYDIDNDLCGSAIPTMDEELEGSIKGSILADQVIKGDETLWWVFNDKGNVHTETQGAAIGMEIRAQAFGFATGDEVNNMTFYSYEIINRSTFELTGTYFCPWVDTDLGFARDDFVGCDVSRGLGYCYNGTPVDGNNEPESYGEQPPAIGVDFFQGPYIDDDGYDNPAFRSIGPGPGFVDDPSTPEVDESCDIVSFDGTELTMNLPDGTPVLTKVDAAAINGVNFGNGIVDDERFGMRRFVYHNNCASGPTCDPDIASEHYLFLQGIWKDNNKMLYGGNAYPTGNGTVGPECDFMFPGDSDPCNWGTRGLPPNGGYNQNGFYWTEETGDGGSPNAPDDRRFMQSAGPFTLLPGAVNYITVGIPWARATSGGPFASVELLRVVDDKAQALFDNCFKVIDGPSAPDLSILELENELIFYLTNSPTSNNFLEQYAEYDPNIVFPDTVPGDQRGDSLYRFEGYQIFQLANPEVGIESIDDPDQARLVAQFDIKNGVGKLVNFYFDEEIGAEVPVIEVNGGDNGISHAFRVSNDAFTDAALINNQQYFYTAIAYAYNEFAPYSQDPAIPGGLFGQKLPYLSGRKNIKTYTAIPHITTQGLVVNSNFGEQPQITRLNGNGNGGLNLELSQETIDEILSKPPASETNVLGGPDYPIAYNPVYEKNAGPVNVQVVDPLSLVEADFELWFDSLYLKRFNNVTNDIEITGGDTASKIVGKWNIRSLTSGEVWSADTTIDIENDQLFLELGISVNILQPWFPGPYRIGVGTNPEGDYPIFRVLEDNNGYIQSSIEYADSSARWLSGVFDDDPPGSSLNWIRSGQYTGDDARFNDWNMSANLNAWDPGEDYESILEGSWAPYSLATFGSNYFQPAQFQTTFGPAYSATAKSLSPISDIASINIVMTPDKSLWSRCPVVETGFDQALTEGNTPMYSLRQSPSVDKEGNPADPDAEPSDNPDSPAYISPMGMGWFPGYVINVETGERLNIIFGESSFLSQYNGRDMLLNPPEKTISGGSPGEQLGDPNIINSGQAVFGGKHYIYIMNHTTRVFDFPADNYTAIYSMPAYDAGKYAHTVLDTLYNGNIYARQSSSYFWATVMYVGIPMLANGQEWLNNEATIKIRVKKPYQKYYSSVPPDSAFIDDRPNNNYPIYAFSTKGLTPTLNNPDKFQSDLDLINVVPNPYYANSDYERNILDNRVRITNLPPRCTVTIFNIGGTKVREYKVDKSGIAFNRSSTDGLETEAQTSIDWDLKNFANVPIASGVYYIHVKSDQGERVVKFFCITRPPYLITF